MYRLVMGDVLPSPTALHSRLHVNNCMLITSPLIPDAKAVCELMIMLLSHKVYALLALTGYRDCLERTDLQRL